MQPEQQQRIMGYFIEEAKDHLNTIEQGLLSLQSTIEDTEMMNEVFRAAHSVKGGAGMLGINSIHRTAHRLEDCLKVLQESPVQVDSDLESLFLQVFDTLEALVEQLQSPFGLSDEIASSMMADAKPVFEHLNAHIEQLVKKTAPATVGAKASKTGKTYPLAEKAPSAKVQPSEKSVNVLPANFKRDVLVQLREMLQVFKQQDLPEHRQQLQAHCQTLEGIGEAVLPGWGELLQTSRKAIAWQENSYRQLAGLVIKEIKQAQELAIAGRSVEIAPSTQLKALVPVSSTTEPEIAQNQDENYDLATDFELDAEELNGNGTTPLDFELDAAELNGNATKGVDAATPAWDSMVDFKAPNLGQDIDLTPEFYYTPSEFASNLTSGPADPSDPEVGIAELNSLADIFEGQTPDLDQTWQEEEIVNLDEQQLINQSNHQSGDDSNDFSDLIGDLADFDLSPTEASSSRDLSAEAGDANLLFEADSREQQTPEAKDADELNNLFGDSFFDESNAFDDTPELGLDAEAVAPWEAFNTVSPGEEFTLQQSETPLFDDSLAFELEDLNQVQNPAFNFDDLPSTEAQTQNREALAPEELLFEQALLFDASSDQEIEELNFDDLDQEEFDLSSFDLDSLGLSNSPAGVEANASRDLFGEDNLDLTAAPDITSLTDFDLEDLFSDLEPENTATASQETDSAMFWDEDSPNLDASVSVFDLSIAPGVDLAQNVQGPPLVEQTSSANIEELPGDSDLDDSSDFFNFDAATNPRSHLSSPHTANELQDDFDDLFAPATQNPDLDALTFEGIDLASLEGSESLQDFDTFNDLFDAETAEASEVESLSFDEFVFDTHPSTPSQQPQQLSQIEAIDVEQTSAESFADFAEFLTDSASEIEALSVTDEDLDALLDEAEITDTLNFAETATTTEAQEWDDFAPEALFESEMPLPQAATDDEYSLWSVTEETTVDVAQINDLEDLMASGQETETEDFLNWDTAETENLDEWLESSSNQSAAELELEQETVQSNVWDDLEASLFASEAPSESFDDLDVLLNATGEASTPATASSFDAFDDLDALLSEEAIASGANALTTSDFDAFDDLDALLNTETPATTQMPVVAQILETEEVDNGFGDLEKLLEQADKTLSGPPIVAPAQGQQRPSNRSRPRVFEQTMRVPVKHLDSLSNLVGELVVNRNSLEQDQERLRQFLDNLSHQVLALSDVGSRMQDLYERSLLESSLLASRHPYRTGNNSLSASNTTNHSGMEYDPLEMDRFTGFHLLSQEMIELIVRVRESASDIEFLVDETDQVARMLRQVTTQLQEGLTRSRMVPFAQTADRLPRAVRDISQKLRKEAQLYVEGRETLIDKMILEHLSDPMTHLINNALTHGIETPEVRRAAGKSSTGKITLKAFHQGNQTVIAVSDDGAGIDPQRVRAKALERKLITPQEAKTLTNLDLYNFLFHPGFTTKDKEDEYAGRGVGMDVVLTSMSEIRGTVHIDSTLGKGTTFTIRLPLTLSICKALCCLSERARIAFPMDGVEDMLDLPGDRVSTNSDGQTCIQWRDNSLPFQPLSDLLKYNRQLSRGTVYGGKREDGMISIVVLRSAGNFIAIQVDQVLGEQEIVIKQLEGPAPKPVGIAGATVLGDGRIMPIADVLELIDLAEGRIRKDNINTLWVREEHEGLLEESHLTKTEPMVLIVDDSITVRELLSMTFSKSGYRVEQARDGQEAWDKLRSGLPCDIVFCDIEMPRMDGLELLSRLQKDETLSHLPIAMLTSRGADRHRQMAAQLGANGYFTKPYLEEVLLEAASRMIKGEVLFGSNSNA